MTSLRSLRRLGSCENLALGPITGHTATEPLQQKPHRRPALFAPGSPGCETLSLLWIASTYRTLPIDHRPPSTIHHQCTHNPRAMYRRTSHAVRGDRFSLHHQVQRFPSKRVPPSPATTTTFQRPSSLSHPPATATPAPGHVRGRGPSRRRRGGARMGVRAYGRQADGDVDVDGYMVLCESTARYTMVLAICVHHLRRTQTDDATSAQMRGHQRDAPWI